MVRYINEQLTSAEVIAQLVELAREVAAEGEDVLAQIARELVAVMRRDVKTDWTARDDVRAELRSSIKRLLVKGQVPAG